LLKLLKEVVAIVRAGAGFRMILHRESRKRLVAYAFDRAVVEVDVRDL
jgi:hypothetical protein